jgi:hypothetical protein
VAIGSAYGQGIGPGWKLFRDGQYEAADAALARAADQSPQAKTAAEALYALGSVRAAAGRWVEAENAWRRLITEHPGSPWVLAALSRLGERAEQAKEWDRARDLTAAFMERYLASRGTGVDDLVCRRMFERLIACERGEQGERATREVHSALKTRYPSDSVVGRVIEYHAGVDPNDPSANLVLNPGFELDARVIGAPLGWSFRGTEPDVQDDADGVFEAGARSALVRPRSGRFCAGKFTGWGKHRGWLFQQIPVIKGMRYDVQAFGHTPAQGGSPGRLRIGVDPQAGVDPENPGLRWSAPILAAEAYQKISLEGANAVQAEGEVMTLFLELRQDQPAEPNAMLFDDVSVSRSK